jgi:hypothetical protein
MMGISLFAISFCMLWYALDPVGAVRCWFYGAKVDMFGTLYNMFRTTNLFCDQGAWAAVKSTNV